MLFPVNAALFWSINPAELAALLKLRVYTFGFPIGEVKVNEAVRAPTLTDGFTFSVMLGVVPITIEKF